MDQTTNFALKDYSGAFILVMDDQDTITAAHGFSPQDHAAYYQNNLHQLPAPFTDVSQLMPNVHQGETVSTTLNFADGLYQVVVLPNRKDHYTGATMMLLKLSEQQRHREDYQHYQLFTEYSNDFLSKYTLDGQCTFMSASVERVLGYAPDEIRGQSVLDFLHPDDKKARRKLISQLIDDSFETPVNYRIRHKEGGYIWLETYSKCITEYENGQSVQQIVAVSRDVTERKETEERLTYLANYDSLTGLPNRALFRDRLRRAMLRAQRNNRRLALFFLDLDRFKNINDSLGHHAGDQLLRGVASRLEQFARRNDTIARLGGDEFTIILEDINNSDDAAIVAQKILEVMAPSYILDGHEVVASPSIGITLYPDDATDMQSLLKNADTAMYRSKEKGRNRYQFYTADMNAKAYEHLILENALRHALDREEFRLYFQPQIDLHTHGVIGIEALVRWEHPEKGLILPEQFVPFAEETGLIHPIGQWVLHAACKELVRWQKAGIPPLRMALNLSMRQFRQTKFVDMVREAIQEYQINPSLLELEITESFLAHNVEQTAETLHQLRDLGVHISVDDFGTGYSSLSYLKKFPLNTLKIDKSFVKDISTDPDGATIAEAIIALGQSLRLHVIAEGVETQEQVFFLRSRGCDRVQGFLFSRPLSSTEAMAWLKKNRSRPILNEQRDLWPEASTLRLVPRSLSV
ncbi:MAG: EAL domain-containing protein [Gammaproteobacteria bacterium]|nr:EAL domain-containing protein [Gammaproteobacteria bacterium]